MTSPLTVRNSDSSHNALPPEARSSTPPPASQVVRFLAENQADLAVHDQRKNTPLHLAAKQNFAAACGRRGSDSVLGAER